MQVILRKRATNYRALLRTQTQILKLDTHAYRYDHRVAMISRLHKNIGLFCRIKSLLEGSFAKETYASMEPTNSSHPIRLEGGEDS